MPITVGTSSITFNDGSVQTSASGAAARGGITTVTLTSSAPNATITSSSGQMINIVTDSTKPASPSVTLPNMTTLSTGSGYFNFFNNTQYIVSLKDSGGTIREVILPGANLPLNIINNGTSTGIWSIAVPARVAGFDRANLLNDTNTSGGNAITVRLDSTNFAVIYASTSLILSARLYTVNPTTKVITVGNKIDVASISSASYPSIAAACADSDNAGRALVGWSGSNSNTMYIGYFGLSVSGGTLYASPSTTITRGIDTDYRINNNFAYLSYLGSGNAFAMCFSLGSDVQFTSTTTYIRGCTVTGTTNVTLTESVSNTSYGNSTGANGSRTNLTDFTVWSQSIGTNQGRVVSYSPGTNTFTVATRSNQTQNLMESLGNASLSSFAAGGFMFSSGKAFYGRNVYDITNSGTASVAVAMSTSFTQKYNISPAYQTQSTGLNVGDTNVYNVRSSFYVNSSSIIAIEGTLATGFKQYTCDPSSSTLNLQTSAAVTNWAGAGNLDRIQPFIISQSLAGLISDGFGSNNGPGADNVIVIASDFGTPIQG